MIPHLARRLRFEKLPAGGQRRNPVPLLVFQVHPRSSLEPLTRVQHGNIFRQRAPPERGVQEHDVKRPRGRAQISRGAHFHDLALARPAQADQLLLQGARSGDGLLDEHQLLRSTGEGLESERTRARKQIETPSTRDVVLQPIEQGLAHPVGSGPEAGNVGETDAAAAPTAADDPH